MSQDNPKFSDGTPIFPNRGSAEPVAPPLNDVRSKGEDRAPLVPMEASVDCRDCGACAGEHHAEGCEVYGLYSDVDEATGACVPHGILCCQMCGASPQL